MKAAGIFSFVLDDSSGFRNSTSARPYRGVEVACQSHCSLGFICGLINLASKLCPICLISRYQCNKRTYLFLGEHFRIGPDVSTQIIGCLFCLYGMATEAPGCISFRLAALPYE